MKRNLSESNVEKVNRVINSSNFKDLTPETLLQAYEEEGIRSLEDLTKRLIAAIQDPNGRPQKISYDLFSEPTPKEILDKIEHKVPEVPFRVDRVEYDPKDIVRFNGKELCYISTSRSRGSELLVIEDKNVWSSFLQTNALASLVSSDPSSSDPIYLGAKGGRSVVVNVTTTDTRSFPGGGAGSVGTTDATVVVGQPPHTKGTVGSLPTSVTMYNDADFDGYSIELEAGKEFFDLTSCYIFWPFDDWNDEISSIAATLGNCVYFEHVHRWGSSLVLERTVGRRNLLEIGWNDRISSVVNFG